MSCKPQRRESSEGGRGPGGRKPSEPLLRLLSPGSRLRPLRPRGQGGGSVPGEPAWQERRARVLQRSTPRGLHVMGPGLPPPPMKREAGDRGRCDHSSRPGRTARHPGRGLPCCGSLQKARVLAAVPVGGSPARLRLQGDAVRLGQALQEARRGTEPVTPSSCRVQAVRAPPPRGTPAARASPPSPHPCLQSGGLTGQAVGVGRRPLWVPGARVQHPAPSAHWPGHLPRAAVWGHMGPGLTLGRAWVWGPTRPS